MHSSARATVLILDDQPEYYLPTLQNRFAALQIHACKDESSARATAARVAPEIVFSWKNTAIDCAVQRDIIDQPSVRWAQVAGAAFEYLMPLSNPGLTLTNSAGVMAAAMAETVTAAMQMFNFRFQQYLQQKAEQPCRQLPRQSLRGKTVLIVGLGHIGQAVAVHAKNLGLTVLGLCNQSSPATVNVDEWVSRERLHESLPRAHYICLHARLTEQTRDLLGEAEFAWMREDAVLINTSRAGLVNQQVMIGALRDGRIAGAYLDLSGREPLSAHSPLWRLQNVVISPHVSDSTSDWPQHFAHFFADNLQRWLSGDALMNVCDLQRGY